MLPCLDTQTLTDGGLVPGWGGGWNIADIEISELLNHITDFTLHTDFCLIDFFQFTSIEH